VSEWVGKHFAPLVHPQDLSIAMEKLQIVLNGVLPPPFELRILTKSKQFIIVEFTATPRVRDNAVHGISGIARDVTQRKLLESQLHVSQKFEAIGQLAGGIAHDFNNILSVIIGYSDFLVTRLPASDPNRECAEHILKAAERAARLTSQLLAFSRKQPQQPEVLNLNSHIKATQPLLQRLMGEDIELEIIPAAILANVKADPSQLEQVLMNLVVNARDAMPTGGKITIQTSNVTLDQQAAAQRDNLVAGNYVLLSVTDTGCGMSPDVQAKIFEPFFTTKPEGKGTGLGLPTCYGIIKQSHGAITLQSEVGRGTTFNIYLPAVAEEATSPESPDKPSATFEGKETILVVEDEESLRELAQLVLTDFGYKVLIATDGVEALRVAAQHKGDIALVVSDVVMPQMGGRELAEKLRALQPALKILFVSGYTDDAVIQRGVSRDSFPFLQKPYTPTSLARKVREVLDKN
jgi:signal transduction histidine kinase